MPRVVRLVALGLLFAAPAPSPLFVTGGADEPRPIEHGDDDDPNAFVFNDSQYCRPFLHTHNPQVVRVRHRFKTPISTDGTDEVAWNCSGVIVGPRAVLTAKHCIISGAGDLIDGTVTTIGGQSFAIKLRSPDAKLDIVLLQVDRPLKIRPAKLASQVPIALTLNGYGCLRRGKGETLPLQRSAITLQESGGVLVIAGCVCHGDSGGPIFDDDGALVGLMVGTENDGKGGRGVLVRDFMRGHLRDFSPSR